MAGSNLPMMMYAPVWKSKFYGAFVPNHRVVLDAIDATPARWRGDAGSSPLDRARAVASLPRNDLVKYCRVHPTHWLISTQVSGRCAKALMWIVRKSPTDSEADQLLELGGLKLAERLKGLHQDDLELQKSAKELMKMLQTVWKSKFKRPSIRGLSWSE